VNETADPHPKVSVIVPMFQAESTVVEAIDSVRNQTFSDWEIILFDDGSTDGTKDVAEREARRDPRKISCYAHPDGRNRGPAETTNAAVGYARTDLILLVNADDIILPDLLEERLRLLRAHPEAVMVWGPAEYFGETTEPYRQPVQLGPDDLYHPPGALLKLFVSDQRGTPCTTGTLFRKDAFVEVGGLEEGLRRGEDIALSLKIAARYPILYDDRVLFRYRRHPNSSTSRSNRSGERARWDLDFNRWCLNFVMGEPGAAGAREEAERQFINSLHRWASQAGWWRSRLLVRAKLIEANLFRRYWWWWMLDLIMPFRTARKLATRLRRVATARTG
jgi:glycosyltransferase involved in cell wall biosynthesis